MAHGQDFEIQSTFRQSIYVTTTGISDLEKRTVMENLPKHIVLEEELSTHTNYLVTYKAVMTEKYLQALRWNTKILSIQWLYNTESSTKKYELLSFEGANFTTLGITNEIFNNYYCQLGATFKDSLSVSTDFLVSKSPEKVEFCEKYGIPVVQPESVFTSEYEVYRKEQRHDAMWMDDGAIFNEKVFFLDPELPRPLFNQLRRMIIERGGTRVSGIDKDVEFILTFSHGHFDEDRLYHYQYVFDCIEAGALLLPAHYKVFLRKDRPVLTNVIACIDSSLGENRAHACNKLRALGAVVKTQRDLSCTHLIIKDRREFSSSKQVPYKIVSSEWIDQCLYTLKHIREDKYIARTGALNLFSRSKEARMNAKVSYVVPRETLFQFTGLPTFLRNKAMAKFDELKIKYSNAEKYEGCTHLIMGSVNTSEKFLSSLCNGRWILRPDFIDAFDGSSGFDFGKYEWHVAESTLEKDRRIVESIRRWRERVEISGRPAFHKWVVKLCCDDAKRESYERVISSGGGRITHEGDYTHCFIARSYRGDVPSGGQYSTDYIFSHLFS
jgi:hypothetical protein